MKLFIFFQDRVFSVIKFRFWCYSWIKRQNNFASKFSPSKVYFEFGVASGDSLINYIKSVEIYCKINKKNISEFYIYVFDSFEGLPDKAHKADETNDWEKGMFSFSKEYVLNKVVKTSFPIGNIKIVKGYFENSLDDSLLEEIKNKKHYPSIINIDCDYYSSTKTIFNWIETLLKSGCIFYFDDFWAFHGHPDMGECKMIHEWNNDPQKGNLISCNIYGLEHHSYLYSSVEWEWR